MYELASVGDLPLPNPSPPSSNKRERDADSPSSSNASDSPSPPLSFEGTRAIAGSRRVRESMQQQTSSTNQLLQPQPQNMYTLPVYSEELGRLPVHGQFSFSPQGPSAPSGSQLSYWNHGTPHDGHIPGQMSSAATSASYPQHNTQVGSFAIDGHAFNPLDVNWNNSVGEHLSYSSLGTLSSTSSTATEFRHMHTASGADFPGFSNSQTMVDSGTTAVWSDAPRGFEYVISSIFHLVD
jgi:hypothetical protein